MHVFPDRARCGFDDVLLHDGFLHVSRRVTGGASGASDDYVDWLRRETGDPRADYQETGIGCNAMTARPWEREERLHPTRWVADESFRFLQRRDPTRPFFLYMSFHRPHAPFDPPGWLWDKYRAQPHAQRPMGTWISRFDDFRRDHEFEAEFGARKESVHHDVRAGYYGSIEFIDLQMNRLQETLHDLRLLENTAIAFVSDHGEMLGDHDMYRKSVGYEGSSHIPFLLHLPASLREGTGAPREVDEIVELRDLMPTLLDLAGVPIPEGVDGASLLPALRAGTEQRADGADGSRVPRRCPFGRCRGRDPRARPPARRARDQCPRAPFDAVDPHAALQVHLVLRRRPRAALRPRCRPARAHRPRRGSLPCRRAVQAPGAAGHRPHGSRGGVRRGRPPRARAHPAVRGELGAGVRAVVTARTRLRGESSRRQEESSRRQTMPGAPSPVLPTSRSCTWLRGMSACSPTV
jgi:hypothetical protein